MADTEQPHERLLKRGPEALTYNELVAIVLRRKGSNLQHLRAGVASTISDCFIPGFRPRFGDRCRAQGHSRPGQGPDSCFDSIETDLISNH